jgi:hypothetical protein
MPPGTPETPLSEDARFDDARQNPGHCRQQPMAPVVDRYLDILEPLT